MPANVIGQRGIHDTEAYAAYLAGLAPTGEGSMSAHAQNGSRV